MKIISIIWAFIFLFLSSGINFHLHLCKGEISDISIFSEAKSCCDIHDEKIATKTSCCKSIEINEDIATCSFNKKSCCEDIEISLFTSSEQLVNSFNLQYNLEFKILDYFYYYFSQLSKNTFEYIAKANAPPDLRSLFFLKIPILFCSLIFYH